MTLGTEEDRAKAAKEEAEENGTQPSYALFGTDPYVIQLGETNHFPVTVTFQVREKGGLSSPVVVEFSANDETKGVEGTNHTFQVHSPWVGAVRYRTPYGPAVTLGRDKAYADQRMELAKKNDPDDPRPDYLYADKTWTIELSEGEYFPCAVEFQSWIVSQEDVNAAYGRNWTESEAKTFQDPTSANEKSVITYPEKDGYTFSVHGEWFEEVDYQIGPQIGTDNWITVGKDAEKAKNNSMYELFDKDNNYAIDPGASPVFPLEVRFRVRNGSGSGTETTEHFDTLTSKLEPLRGHTFTLRESWAEEITYQIIDRDGDFGAVMTVGTDAEYAKTHSRYGLFAGDGSYTIALNLFDDVAFPMKVRFATRDAKGNVREDKPDNEHEFKTINDTVTVGGHVFKLYPAWGDQVAYELPPSVRACVYNPDDPENPTDPPAWVTVGTGEEFKKTADAEAAEVQEANEKRQAAYEEALAAAEEGQEPDAPLPIRPSNVYAEKDVVTIEVEDDAFFPYGITFTSNHLLREKNTEVTDWGYFLKKDGKDVKRLPTELTRTVFFEGPDDEQRVGNFTFKIVSKRTNPNRLVKAGLQVGGTYVPLVRDVDYFAYWNIKESEAQLQSLLPLDEVGLRANLNGFFPEELEDAVLKIERPVVDGKQAEEAVVWARTNDDDNYEILTASGARTLNEISNLESGRYEMIVGSHDQLDPANTRYIIDVYNSQPAFSDDMLIMQAAYANAGRGGLSNQASSFTFPADTKPGDPDPDSSFYYLPEGAKEEEARYIGVYRFNIVGALQQKSVYITMRGSDGGQDNPGRYHLGETTETDGSETVSKPVYAPGYNYDNRAWEDFKDLTPAVYEGVYFTGEDLEKAEKLTDLADMVWGKDLDRVSDTSKLYKTDLVPNSVEGAPTFTVAWYRTDSAGKHLAALMPFRVLVDSEDEALYVDTSTDYVQFHTPHTAERDNSGNYTDNLLYKWDLSEYDEETGLRTLVYEVQKKEEDNSGSMDRFYVSGVFHHYISVPDYDQFPNDGFNWDSPNAESHFVSDDYSAVNTHGDYEQRVSDGKALWQQFRVRVYAGSKGYATPEEAQKDGASDVSTQFFSKLGYGAAFSGESGMVFTVFSQEGTPVNAVSVNNPGQMAKAMAFKTNTLREVVFGDLKRFTNGREDENFKPGRTDERRAETTFFTMPQASGGGRYSPSSPYSLRVSYTQDYTEQDAMEMGLRVVIGDRKYEDMTYQQALNAWRQNGEESGDVFRARDVSELAFSETGYTANYEPGIHFNVFQVTKGENGVEDGPLLAYRLVRTVERTANKSADTWLQMYGARGYESYVMPYNDDSYYERGYQTVFLMNYGRNPETGEFEWTPVQDDTEIIPLFSQIDTSATVYRMHDEGGSPQKSGESRVTYHAGASGIPDALPYSAAAENGTHLKNYYVTFLTRQEGGPKLFVNGMNDASHTVKDASGALIPEREVFIGKSITSGQDIFFANIGDEPLEGLKVELSANSGLRLDDYWTIADGTRTLAAMDDLEVYKNDNGNMGWYGELPNVAKIRVFAEHPEKAQDIDAWLTISGNGGGVSQKIHLTGKIGDIRIDSPEEGELVLKAVKWVPYANLIHTNIL
ncbi:MAG: hypothetical protein IJT94_18640 [Oscillibacter sp.]|nr:hypothetical protein [Oscillibacter sp.]